jgi:ribonuclease-3
MTRNHETSDPRIEQVRFENEIRRVERALREDLGLSFGRKERLHQAFQHRSCLSEDDRTRSYERLEFLGDRVLELCVGAWLFKTRTEGDEGELSQEIAWRVDEANLAQVEERLQIKRALRLGHSLTAEDISERMVADVVEAIIGAIYLEFDLDAAWRFIETYVPLNGDPPESFHATNQLLERCRELRLEPPQFVEVMEGPENQAVWKVECVIEDRRTLGQAKQKREARKKACQAMLPLLTGKSF